MDLASVLLLSNRPLAHALFAGLAELQEPSFVVDTIPATPDSLVQHRQTVDQASVAIVDVCTDHAAAVRVCQALRAALPQLPLLALLCCPHTVSPETMQALRN